MYNKTIGVPTFPSRATEIAKENAKKAILSYQKQIASVSHALELVTKERELLKTQLATAQATISELKAKIDDLARDTSSKKVKKEKKAEQTPDVVS